MISSKPRRFWIVVIVAAALVVVAASVVTISIMVPWPWGPPMWTVRFYAAFQKPHVFDYREGLLGVRYGMKREEVWRVLGRPYCRPGFSTDSADEYLYRGFAVLYSKRGGVSSFMCGAGSSDAAVLAKAFRGRTPEGIGMGATKEEVLRVYGNPTSNDLDASGSGALVYRPRKGDLRHFTFTDGKLTHLAFFFVQDGAK